VTTSPQEPPEPVGPWGAPPPDPGFAPPGGANAQDPYSGPTQSYFPPGSPYGQSEGGYPPPMGPPPVDAPPPGYQQPYGQYPGYPPPQAGYGFGQQYGMSQGMPQGVPPLASWWQRVGAYLLDNVLVGIALGLIAGWSDSTVFSRVADLLSLVWAVYNAYLAGKTGQSYGKRATGIRLARVIDGQPVGVGYGLLRWFLDSVFLVLCFLPGLLNFLWPLWDQKSQTWCDKIASSVVVRSS
jgi:uncharacterized RDD family membrane protein YckC